jgi:alanine dehydrogenase
MDTKERMITMLTDQEVEKVLTIEVALKALEKAFEELGKGDAVVRPRSRTFVATSQKDHFYCFNSMDGGGSKLGVYALRFNSDILRWSSFQGGIRSQRIEASLPRERRFTGLILLFDLESGLPFGILPDFSVTMRRVAGVTGVATEYMARKDAHILGIIGSGAHAISHALTLSKVRDIDCIKVYSPKEEHRLSFAERIKKMLKIEVQAVDQAEKAVRGSDILVTSTNSIGPVFKTEWVEKGMHVNSIYQPEVPPDMDRHSDLVVIKGKQKAIFFSSEKVGTTPDMESYEDFNWEGIPELADLVVGKIRGRTNSQQITFFRNNEGLGFEFASLGKAACQLAKEKGLGRQIPLDWFCSDRRSGIFGDQYHYVNESILE